MRRVHLSSNVVITTTICVFGVLYCISVLYLGEHRFPSSSLEHQPDPTDGSSRFQDAQRNAEPRSTGLADDEQLTRGRAKAAVLGAFVADAASMGLHWCVLARP